MEELLSSLNDGTNDGIGLNLIASSPKVPKLKKPKNASKCDKRRNKSAKARGENLKASLSQQIHVDNEQQNASPSISTLTTPSSSTSSQISSSKPPINHPMHQASLNNATSPNVAYSPNTTKSPNLARNTTTTNNTNITTNNTTNTTNSGSRSKHTLNLDNTDERSNYYSTYHARPSELDRKTGNAETAAELSKNSTTSTTIFSPSSTFKDLGLHDKIVEGVTKMGIEKPTGVQVESCGVLLGGKGNTNLFVQSETGSGKTLAYLLPILHHLTVDAQTSKLKKIDRKMGGTRCLVLCPTRELASQTILTANKLCAGSFNWIVPGCLSGGEKRKSEKVRVY